MRALSHKKAFAFGLMLLVLSSCGSSTSEPRTDHEQKWVVDSVGRDISEIVLFAAKQKSAQIDLTKIRFQTDEATDLEKYSFHLSTSGDASQSISNNFALKEYVWSPANFEAWAKELIEYNKIKSASPDYSADAAYVKRLGQFNSKSLFAENERISKDLTKDPLNSDLHAQAALLSAAFALRESASCFDDVRPALNRVAAHLSLSRATSESAPHKSSCYQLANIALLTLAGRCTDSVAKIDSWTSSNPTELDQSIESWLRGLKIRATGDFRLADLKQATPFEQLQYGRALADGVGSDYLADYLSKNKLATSAIDWIRIGARGVSTVESGHIFAEPGVAAEVLSLKDDIQLYENKTLDIKNLKEALNELPTRCLSNAGTPHLEIISWGDVSAFDSRHLVDSFFQKYTFEQSRWSVPEEAKKTLETARKMCEGVTLFPLFEVSQRWLDRTRTNAEGDKGLQQLLLTQPQIVNANLWHRCIFVSENPFQLPAVYDWFKPRFLFGTTFDFVHRNFDGDADIPLKDLEAMKKLNPYDHNLCYAIVWTRYPHGNFNSQQMSESYGALADYDLTAMQAILDASKSDPATRLKQLKKMSEFKPALYFSLGEYYVEHDQPELAKTAYEKGVALSKDDVATANDCRWLVNYYYDQGQVQKAVELAKFAADVYSGAGLTTMAALCERMNKLSDAESYFKKCDERYDDKPPLMAFYRRHAKEYPEQQASIDNYVKQLFPNGQVKVEATALHGAPVSGARVEDSSEVTQKYKIIPGEVVVGVNGVAVETQLQYRWLCQSNPDNTFKLIVWNGHEFRTVNMVLFDRRLHCTLKDLH